MNQIFSAAAPANFIFCHSIAHWCMRAWEAGGNFSIVPGPSLNRLLSIGSSGSFCGGGTAVVSTGFSLGCGATGAGETGGASIVGRSGGRGVEDAAASACAILNLFAEMALVVSLKASTIPKLRVSLAPCAESRKRAARSQGRISAERGEKRFIPCRRGGLLKALRRFGCKSIKLWGGIMALMGKSCGKDASARRGRQNRPLDWRKSRILRFNHALAKGLAAYPP